MMPYNVVGKGRPHGRIVALEYFVHPIPLLAVGVLIANDHYFKFAYHNWWTGKISDAAGLFFLPLFLSACVGLTQSVFRPDQQQEWGPLTRLRLIVMTLISDLILILLNTSATFVEFYQIVMAHLMIPTRVTIDVSDLLVLPVNFLTYWFARPYFHKIKNGKSLIE